MSMLFSHFHIFFFFFLLILNLIFPLFPFPHRGQSLLLGTLHQWITRSQQMCTPCHSSAHCLPQLWENSLCEWSSAFLFRFFFFSEKQFLCPNASKSEIVVCMWMWMCMYVCVFFVLVFFFSFKYYFIAQKVACGEAHSAAVSASGRLYTWGRASYGRLGHGDREDLKAPKLVDDRTATCCVCACVHVCVCVCVCVFLCVYVELDCNLKYYLSLLQSGSWPVVAQCDPSRLRTRWLSYFGTDFRGWSVFIWRHWSWQAWSWWVEFFFLFDSSIFFVLFWPCLLLVVLCLPLFYFILLLFLFFPKIIRSRRKQRPTRARQGSGGQARRANRSR